MRWPWQKPAPTMFVCWTCGHAVGVAWMRTIPYYSSYYGDLSSTRNYCHTCAPKNVVKIKSTPVMERIGEQWVQTRYQETLIGEFEVNKDGEPVGYVKAEVTK